jgi:hypothetical protein
MRPRPGIAQAGCRRLDGNRRSEQLSLATLDAALREAARREGVAVFAAMVDIVGDRAYLAQP